MKEVPQPHVTPNGPGKESTYRHSAQSKRAKRDGDQKQSDTRSCALCPNTAVSRCSSCRSVFYCGRQCQARHWLQGHREECHTQRNSALSSSAPSQPKASKENDSPLLSVSSSSTNKEQDRVQEGKKKERMKTKKKMQKDMSSPTLTTASSPPSSGTVSSACTPSISPTGTRNRKEREREGRKTAKDERHLANESKARKEKIEEVREIGRRKEIPPKKQERRDNRETSSQRPTSSEGKEQKIKTQTMQTEGRHKNNGMRGKGAGQRWVQKAPRREDPQTSRAETATPAEQSHRSVQRIEEVRGPTPLQRSNPASLLSRERVKSLDSGQRRREKQESKQKRVEEENDPFESLVSTALRRRRAASAPSNSAKTDPDEEREAGLPVEQTDKQLGSEDGVDPMEREKELYAPSTSTALPPADEEMKKEDLAAEVDEEKSDKNDSSSLSLCAEDEDPSAPNLAEESASPLVPFSEAREEEVRDEERRDSHAEKVPEPQVDKEKEIPSPAPPPVHSPRYIVTGFLDDPLACKSEEEEDQGRDIEETLKVEVEMKANVETVEPEEAGAAARKRKKKKKKRGKKIVRKTIQWGDVTVREFERVNGGGGGVPLYGSWSLGLGKAKRNFSPGSVDQVEERRKWDLERRAERLSPALKKLANGETRQFDYIVSKKNPLFGPLLEGEREKLLVESLKKHEEHGETTEAAVPGRRKSQTHRSPSISGESFELGEVALDGGKSPEERAMREREKEEYAELHSLRESRREQSGCSCSWKQTKPSKLNLKQLRDALKAKGLSTTGTKADLVARLKAELSSAGSDQTSLCSGKGQACECEEAGIPCHYLVCHCCHGNTQTCSNPMGHSHYSAEKVKSYRKSIFAALRKKMEKEEARDNQEKLMEKDGGQTESLQSSGAGSLFSPSALVKSLAPAVLAA